MKIGFIGCGKMAQVMMNAFVESGVANSSQIICSDVNHDLLEESRVKYDVWISKNNEYVFENADIVFLAVKPQAFSDAVAGCKDKIRSAHQIVSIMAGVTIQHIQELLPAPVIRVMPNTPCIVGQMAAGYAVGDNVSPQMLEFVEKLLSCTGTAFRVDEPELDAVTGLSGSGPAFVAYLIQKFIDAGVEEGLSPEISHELTIKTFIGTGILLQEKHLSPEELITMVSSPNGTTVAGREILEKSDIGEIICKTIARASARSRELS